MTSESMDKILDKNNKMNKILMDYKKRAHGLTIIEKIRYHKYRKLFISPDELGVLVNNLFELSFLDCGFELDDFGQKIPSEPFITKNGVNAIKTHYFSSGIHARKVSVLIFVFGIVAFMSIVFGIRMYASNSRLKSEIKQKDAVIDSLKTEIIEIEKKE